MQVSTSPTRAKQQRILGIDYGLCRFGLALSDINKVIATPLMTFIAEKKIDQTIIKLIALLNQLQEENKYEIIEIVIGLPLMMSGKSGFIADEVKHFVQHLSQSITIPIITWDERLTTVQAERSLRESNMTRKKRSKVVDKISAAIILQCYLDNRNIRLNLT